MNPKILPCNQPARLFDHQNLFKESIGLLDFFTWRYFHYRNEQLRLLFLVGLLFFSYGAFDMSGGMGKLKLVYNERLLSFKQNQFFFLNTTQSISINRPKQSPN